MVRHGPALAGMLAFDVLLLLVACGCARPPDEAQAPGAPQASGSATSPGGPAPAVGPSGEQPLSVAASPVKTGGKIAFLSDRDGTPDIYVMNLDGSDVRRLTDNPGTESQLAWSPDGTKIAFRCSQVYPADAGDRVLPYGIGVVNADGSGLTKLLEPREWEQSSGSPAWSPDGKQIAFAREKTIFVMNADGSGARALLPPSSRPRGHRLDPAWSPDGKKILFVSGEGDPEPTARRPWSELWIMNADGSHARPLKIDYPGSFPNASNPSWSTDGKTIAFHNFWPYLVSPDGSNQRPFLGPPGRVLRPSTRLEGFSRLAWSPDGSLVAFSAALVTYRADPKAPDGITPERADSEIYIAHPDGTGLVNITNNPAQDWDPAWSPR